MPTVARLSPAMALLPLRLFLGVTFVYAGVQKLSDPGFLHAGASTYIGTQLEGFANGTPGGFVLRAFAIPHPGVAGIGVAIAEILIGLLVTGGLFTRVAAATGMGLNFLLFLTASWKTTPYFLGPDLVFTFAWLPFVLAGASGQPALDNAASHPSEAMLRRTRLRPADPDSSSSSPVSTRRALLMELGGVALAIAGVSSLVKGGYAATSSLSAAAGQVGSAKSSGAGKRGGTQGSGRGGGGGSVGGSAVPHDAVRLGAGRRLPSGQGATYPDPGDGSPDIVIRDSEGNLNAFSAVCTHAGCTVGYEGGVIVCPCHGGEYSAETGEVIAGPPSSGLAPKKVLEEGGQIYALPS